MDDGFLTNDDANRSPAGDCRELVRASAGTGKTYQLSTRYLRLLARGHSARSILATTFTRKAAGEILDRVLARLAAAVIGQEDADDELAVAVGTPPQGKPFAEWLARIVQSLDQVHIETLDAFFVRLASVFRLELGMPCQWRIVDEAEMSAIMDVAIQASLGADSARDIIGLLAQGDAHRNIGQLVRETVEHLLDVYRHSQPSAWQCPSVGRRMDAAALERALTEYQNIAMTAPLAKARDEDIVRWHDGDWNKFLSTGLVGKVAAGELTFRRTPIPPRAVEIAQSLIVHTVAVICEPMVERIRGAGTLLAQFDTNLRELQYRLGAYRFEDIAAQAAESMTAIDGARMAWRLDDEIDHLLLDEFQDTSLTQWTVLEPLARRILGRGHEQTFFAVGDTKQAIYGWRGGEADLFEVVARLVGQERNPLNASRRSSRPVIDTVNRIFGNLTAHPALGRFENAVTKWSERFAQHETIHAERPGWATVEIPSEETDIRDYAVSRICELASQWNGSIGVLVRTNKLVADLIYRLGKAGIVASDEGRRAPLDSAAVRLVLSALHLVDHPQDTAAQFHLAHSPLAEIFGLKAHATSQDQTAVDIACQAVRTEITLRGFGEVIARWAKVLDASCTLREAYRLEQVVQLTFQHNVAATNSATDLVRLIQGSQLSDPSAARVRVMTIHQAKGLEFDIVVLPELDFALAYWSPRYVVRRESTTSPVCAVYPYAPSEVRRWLPAEWQAAIDEHWTHEGLDSLSVLYVATTRARYALHCLLKPAAQAPHDVTAASLVRAALGITEGAAKGPVVWQHGDPDWMAKIAELEQDVSAPAPARSVPEAVRPARRARPATTTSARNLPRVTPSSFEGGQTISAHEILGRAGDRQTKELGSLVHACFELVEWQDDGPIDAQRLRERCRQLEDATPEDIEAAIAQFQAALQQPTLRHLLSRDFYRIWEGSIVTCDGVATGAAQRQLDFGWSPDTRTDVEAAAPESRGATALSLEVVREQPIATLVDGRIMSGSIDRCVLGCRDGRRVAADIIDFKTDAIHNDKHLARRVAYYRPQLQAYRVAVAAMTGLPAESIGARLMFVRIDRCVSV